MGKHTLAMRKMLRAVAFATVVVMCVTVVEGISETPDTEVAMLGEGEGIKRDANGNAIPCPKGTNAAINKVSDMRKMLKRGKARGAKKQLANIAAKLLKKAGGRKGLRRFKGKTRTITKAVTTFDVRFPITKKAWRKRNSSIQSDMAKKLGVKVNQIKSSVRTTFKKKRRRRKAKRGIVWYIVWYIVVQFKVTVSSTHAANADKKQAETLKAMKRITAGKVKLGGIKVPSQKPTFKKRV